MSHVLLDPARRPQVSGYALFAMSLVLRSTLVVVSLIHPGALHRIVLNDVALRCVW